MANYVIGDLQGCFDSLLRLLSKIGFSASRDTLWLAGDLVNRGPDSVSCLRFARQADAKVVLGNHDLHLLACYYSKRSLKKKDTLQQVFDADDCHGLMDWLRKQPLMIRDDQLNCVMVHAGLPHIWTLDEAEARANEVHAVLSSDDLGAHKTYFENMYGNEPEVWCDSLQGPDRLRVITNYLTRMRFINKKGALDLKAKEGVETAPKGYKPWFSYPAAHHHTITFGHWAALEGKTGHAQFQAIDTGCVWGGSLTALNLATLERVSVTP